MPELPEVETVRCQLAGALEGAVFLVVEQVEPFMLRDCSPEEVIDLLPGRRIERVDRLGKFIIAALDDDLFLTLHLGMTGQVLVDPMDRGVHTRFVFRLLSEGTVGAGRPSESDAEGGHGAHASSGREVRLEFRDMRKFGRFHLTKGSPAPRLALLGPDAWKGDWDEEYLARRLKRRTAPLKAFLLDQRHLAGVGNIYADEILWWSALSPLREAGSLVEEQICCLASEIRTRLTEGVRLLGCSLSDFVDTAGREGGFQEWLQAYGRQGEECRRCGATLVRTVIAGRGTAYCPECQR
jgi:formamidopyrimidine-DNA glycosylase